VAVANLQSTAELGYQYESESIGQLVQDDADAFAADPVTIGDEHLSGHLHAYRRLMHDDALRSPGIRRVTLSSGGTVHLAAAENSQAASRERPLSIPVGLGRSLGDVINPAAIVSSNLATPGSRRSRQHVWAVLRDIEAPTDSSTRMRVFVNCGELSPSTEVSNPHYATSVSFFGSQHAAHHAGHGIGAPGPSVSVDLSPALSRISRTKYFQGDKLMVQLMPVCHGADARASMVRPRRVEVAIF
jgi:hypothetical protein